MSAGRKALVAEIERFILARIDPKRTAETMALAEAMLAKQLDAVCEDSARLDCLLFVGWIADAPNLSGLARRELFAHNIASRAVIDERIAAGTGRVMAALSTARSGRGDRDKETP